MNGAQALIRTLVDADVTTCFSNPGTSEMHFVAALDSVPGMRCVLGLFEGVVTGAADGYARMAGKPAATLLHSDRASATGSPTCTTRAARRRRSSTSSATTRPITASYDAPLTADIEGWARSVSRWVRTAAGTAQREPDAAEAVSRRARASGPDRHADPALRHVVGRRRPSRRRCRRRALRRSPPTRSSTKSRGRCAAASAARSCWVAVRCAPTGCWRPHGSAASTGCKLLTEVFPTRVERGAGLPAVERLAYVPELASVQLRGLQHLILVDTKTPVTFFAYPGKNSSLVPSGCEVHELAAPSADVLGTMQALVRALDVEHVEPERQQLSRPDRAPAA